MQHQHEQLAELLARYTSLDEAQRDKAVEQIRAGERLLNEARHPEPTEQLLRRVRAAVGSELARHEARAAIGRPAAAGDVGRKIRWITQLCRLAAAAMVMIAATLWLTSSPPSEPVPSPLPQALAWDDPSYELINLQIEQLEDEIFASLVPDWDAPWQYELDELQEQIENIWEIEDETL